MKYTQDLISYENFNNLINDNIKILNNYLKMLNKVKVYNLSVNKLFELGHLMKCFYKLHNDKNIIGSLYFSFGCNGYIKNIEYYKNI